MTDAFKSAFCTQDMLYSLNKYFVASLEDDEMDSHGMKSVVTET